MNAKHNPIVVAIRQGANHSIQPFSRGANVAKTSKATTHGSHIPQSTLIQGHARCREMLKFKDASIRIQEA